MVQLVSGRVLKTPSANVSAERYQFIEISEAEPDLGVPPANNYIFTSDPDGNRQWVDLRTTLANEDFLVGNITVADTIFGNGLIVQNINILDAIIGITTLANNIVTVTILADSITSNTWNNLYTANVIESPENLYYTDGRVIANLNVASIDIFRDVADLSNIDFGQGLIWDGNAFAPVYISSDLANIADLALRVASIENFTTANVREVSSNLYFTNSRVLDALVEANVIVNDLFVSGDLVVQGNSAVLNVATLIVEDKNIVIANGAASASIADGAGITIEGADANIVYRESGDKIEINKNLDVTGNIIAGSGGGGSITGANIIIGETLVSNLLQVDTAVSNLVITDSIQFNTSADIEVSEGEMAWNSSDGTLDIGLQYGDVVLQVGQETHYVVRNNTGETIENGTAVYCDGITVGSGRIQANLMIGDGSIDPVQFLGLATHDITSGINGVVTYFGYVRGLDTRGTENTAISDGNDPDGWAVGDKLYVHPTAPGKLTKIEPEAPNTKICVAVIVNRHENVGVLFVRPTTNLRLTKLSDVQIANVESNQFLVYDNNRWENITVDTDNILEGSNLYYTNARVLANVSEMSINVLADVDITDILPGQILSWDGDKFVSGSADIALFSERSNSAVVANTVLSLEGLTTDDLNEGTSNLYYSDDRVVTAVTPLLTTANVVEADNLYYTNARVLANVSEMSVNVLADVDITDIATGEILVWDGNKFIPGTSDIALFSETANSALIANTVVSLNDFTTDNLNEGSANLYFTSRRAIDSFTAGRGIIITEGGTISSVDDSELYNTSIDNSVYSIVTSEGKNIITTNSSPSDAAYLVHSLQITNIADNTVYVSGNVQYASGRNVDLLNRIKMPIGSSLEILEKSLVLLPGDKVNLVTSNGNISVVGSYESVYEDETFINPSLSIATANSDSLLHNSNLSYTILETIKISNLDNKDIPVKIKITDANNDPKGYLVYNLKIPQNSIVDILQKPKRLEFGDKLFASYANSANSNAVSVFVSGRLGAISSAEIVPASIDGTPGNTIVGFSTTEPEGSTLYYTFTEV